MEKRRPVTSFTAVAMIVGLVAGFLGAFVVDQPHSSALGYVALGAGVIYILDRVEAVIGGWYR